MTPMHLSELAAQGATLTEILAYAIEDRPEDLRDLEGAIAILVHRAVEWADLGDHGYDNWQITELLLQGMGMEAEDE